jgi:hypothetical protein
VPCSTSGRRSDSRCSGSPSARSSTRLRCSRSSAWRSGHATSPGRCSPSPRSWRLYSARSPWSDRTAYGRACTRRPAIPAAREPRRRSPARGGSARDLRRAGRRWLHRRTLARSRRLAAGRSRTCDDPAAGGRGPGRPLARRPLAGRPGAPRRRIRGDRGGRPGVREVHLHAVLAVAASTRPARAGPVAVAASALLAAAMVLGQLWFFHYRELFSVDDVAWLVVARDVLLVALYGVLLAALRRSTKIPSSSSTVSHSPLASSLANGIAAVDGAERRSR